MKDIKKRIKRKCSFNNNSKATKRIVKIKIKNGKCKTTINKYKVKIKITIIIALQQRKRFFTIINLNLIK